MVAGTGVLLLGPGDPAHAPAMANSFTTLGPSGWELYTLANPGDADYDGREDLLARNVTTNTVHLYRGATNHSLAARTTWGTSVWSVTDRPLLASGNDADYNGVPDLWATDNDGNLRFYPGNYDGSGNPTSGASVIVGSGGRQDMTDIS
ncbi:hypothetical protein POF50_002220 [Streptomyces sp. SL13]|uniref:VCBS repeat-containing protein n=1 Tax=Streptantibioticus silvisoli TaxID=2705255 RepID=A0AA90JVV2_9ACTN|nr:hypothetical protein [Streptantibioticus silvisoli]MDI5968171.1 hypothetical protein [Streptantibioticus silvisoli]